MEISKDLLVSHFGCCLILGGQIFGAGGALIQKKNREKRRKERKGRKERVKEKRKGRIQFRGSYVSI